MSPHRPLRIRSTAGPGVREVERLLLALYQRDDLDATEAAMAEGVREFQRTGRTSCHLIALKLLADLHNGGSKGWKLLQGPFKNGAHHSWLEKDGVAVDGSLIVRGKPTVVVASVGHYREASGSRVRRTFTVDDLLDGTYQAEAIGRPGRPPTPDGPDDAT